MGSRWDNWDPGWDSWDPGWDNWDPGWDSQNPAWESWDPRWDSQDPRQYSRDLWWESSDPDRTVVITGRNVGILGGTVMILIEPFGIWGGICGIIVWNFQASTCSTNSFFLRSQAKELRSGRIYKWDLGRVI